MLKADMLPDEKREEREYIEAIKLAAGCLHYKGLSVKGCLEGSIGILAKYAEEFKNTKYLEMALLQIRAYLEMGFPYEDNKDLFDDILQILDAKEVCFQQRFYRDKISLNRQSVRSMIKKWPASPQQDMKIGEVVTDIISKVSEHDRGIYYYKNVVTGEMYELVIHNDEMFFHDLQRSIFYQFDV